MSENEITILLNNKNSEQINKYKYKFKKCDYTKEYEELLRYVTIEYFEKFLAETINQIE